MGLSAQRYLSKWVEKSHFFEREKIRKSSLKVSPWLNHAYLHALTHIDAHASFVDGAETNGTDMTHASRGYDTHLTRTSEFRNMGIDEQNF